jgi:murein DD-endopeptidase MepM/ murein hydrolase activator NlpD
MGGAGARHRHHGRRLIFRAPLALLLLLGAAQAQPAPGALALPVTPTCISSFFGPREGAGRRASTFHQGIDLPAPAGAWVRAAAAGQVVSIRRIGGTGLEVTLRHDGGWLTRYAHMGQVAPALANGRRVVAQGEALGRIGRTGVSYGPHLHFELVVNGARVDPAPHLDVAPCPPRAP